MWIESCCIILLYLFFNVYLFLRERQHTSRGGAEREGDRGSEAGSALTAERPMQGSNSWTKIKNWVFNRLRQLGAIFYLSVCKISSPNQHRIILYSFLVLKPSLQLSPKITFYFILLFSNKFLNFYFSSKVFTMDYWFLILDAFILWVWFFVWFVGFVLFFLNEITYTGTSYNSKFFLKGIISLNLQENHLQH